MRIGILLRLTNLNTKILADEAYADLDKFDIVVVPDIDFTKATSLLATYSHDRDFDIAAIELVLVVL